VGRGGEFSLKGVFEQKKTIKARMLKASPDINYFIVFL
jgi:hypothetical protein